MRLGKPKTKPIVQQKSIFEQEKELRKQALALAQKQPNPKPIRYLIKDEKNIYSRKSIR